MSDLTYTDDDSGHERCRNCNADWTEYDALRAQVQAVRALHQPIDDQPNAWCKNCAHQPFPCPTIRALDGAE